ncbi:N-acetylmuramoyl-L-alanine amidase [Arenibacter nanhaiticus]|uniref:N-acetylmuramoyl-L-alanine amidase n=1 Tax=Arenibacter nanhaiticus TaxID=558155 RepID=A0A1M6GV34_9FLAO|nr:N-acetylmuramoyl-L-alanine amidase [Arenibacter nanhaiticus]SHJ13831.1 N-acetylmuramoyl-L-alanine amidase [Arenibacter nanhaiticus]
MRLKRFYLIPLVIVVFLLSSFGKNNTNVDNDDEFVVVLDAGHGGHDPGNMGNGYLEKNIALKIVLKVGALLERNPNIKVIYTRKDDTFVDLYRRGEIANKANADLFVSVHCDSHNSDAHGAGTFVLGLHANKQNFDIAKKENSVIYLEDNYESRYAAYNINSPESVIGLTIMQEEFLDQSIRLAKLMQDNFAGRLKRNDRKVKQAGFIVLHQTFMPSVLVETGFLTNKNEGAYLNSSRGHNEMASAIADAILSYKGEVVVNTDIVQNIPDTPDSQNSAVDKKKDLALNSSDDQKFSIPNTAVAREKVTEKTIEKSSANNTNIVFKVQILASSKNLSLKSENFKGLNALSKESYKNLYRYMYGNTGSHSQAKELKSNADAKGYTSSYIVAYKDGKRISEAEALKYVSE